jgi:hypothetical protein
MLSTNVHIKMSEIRRSGRKRTANSKYDNGLPDHDDSKQVNKRLRDARYRASQETKAKRKETYDPVKRKQAYKPEVRQLRHQATYNPVARKASYDPAARKASYDPAARRASYLSQLPQWSLNNVDKIPQHTKVKQEWGYDEDEKCPYCMCIFLRSAPASFRRKCCNNGAYCESIPYLQPLLKSLQDVVDDEEELKHFTSSSSSYNNILSLGKILYTKVFVYKKFCIRPET